MSFRRNSEESLKWQKWLQQHRDELVACGIPQVVLEDSRNWYYFLDHNYFTPPGGAEPIIDIERMNKADAERFCLFLERDGFDPSCSVLNRLQYLLKRGRRAER